MSSYMYKDIRACYDFYNVDRLFSDMVMVMVVLVVEHVLVEAY